jgi:hypothetical protein
MEEVVGHVRGEVLKVSQEMTRFAVAHFLEQDKMAMFCHTPTEVTTTASYMVLFPKF